ncbi:jerky protein homolog-like [Wyeomyia smithii]|uniref:jerky protein homolog-like n=1 Tax=Wyeomyia smithii TaxID=174621 RepID=UPI002467E486|nr:jerky protein homolog-like [Wyeomyia smithii]
MENTSTTKPVRKHTTLTLAEKVRIIEEIEGGLGTHESIGRKYGVAGSTVTRFLQNKSALRLKLEQYQEHGIENRKTMKEQSFSLVEKALYVWILQQREAGIIVTSEILRAKAALLFGLIQERGAYVNQNITFSDGWARRFKHRFGLRVKRVVGEKVSADVLAYSNFKPTIAMRIDSMQLKESQIYNADESAIFFKLLASRTVVMSNERRAYGRKINKTRYTFMPCCNADGSNKLKLMFIDTAAKPRSLPTNDMLPVEYYHSKKAWMTRELFRTWFFKHFVPAVRTFSTQQGLEPKALLVLDNCKTHYDGGERLESDDGLIQIIYLPPNVTSECQPMDQSVINAIKTRYKRKLMLTLVLENENLPFQDRLKKITLLQSVNWLSEAWDEITPSTIRNSWKKLIDPVPDEKMNTVEQVEKMTMTDMKALAASIDASAGTSTSDTDLELWLTDQVYDADNNPAWITHQVYSDEEISNGHVGVSDPMFKITCGRIKFSGSAYVD